MAFPPEATGDVVARAARRVGAAGDADEAVRALTEVIGAGYPLSRVSVRILEGADRLVMVSVWTREGATEVKPGDTMSLLASSFPEVVRAGRPVLGSPDPRMLEDILREEGVRAWVAVPLCESGAVRGLLNFSSDRSDGFAEEDAVFFDELGRAIESALLRLTRP